MTTSDVLASLALAVAALSLGVAWWGTFRDRVSLKIFATHYEARPEYGNEYIRIKVVNTGRRVAVLTMFGGDCADGTWQGTHIGKSGAGLSLAESEFHERNFFAGDIEVIAPDSSSEFITLWFEDSHGRRHKVPRSEELIQKLKGISRPNEAFQSDG